MLSLVSANTAQQLFHYSFQSTNRTTSWTNNRRLPVLFFFDVKKVFDSVPHYSLLMKLTELDVPFILLRWVKRYLSNRLQLVVLGGEHSHWLYVLSVVPQGSILGLLLFLVYTNNLVNVSLSQGCEIVMFADDILMCKPITGDEDLASFQADIDSFANWMSANHLCLNLQKTKLVILSHNRRKLQPILFLNGIQWNPSTTDTIGTQYFVR